MSKVDLNKPAFGPNSQKLNQLEEVKAAPETSEEVKEEKEPEVEPKESVVEEEEKDESKVPYSRFKKFHERALEAETKAREYESRLNELEARYKEKKESPTFSKEMPDYWKEMYGDSEASSKAWSIEQRRQEEILEMAEQRAEERAIRAMREERGSEERRLNENVQTIDSELERVSDKVGRDLTEKEQSALLDIVDDFTPKDEDGNYVGQTLPMEKAWEIYELKTQGAKIAKQNSRNAAAAPSSSGSEGGTNAGDKDKNWNPSWSALPELIRKATGR